MSLIPISSKSSYYVILCVMCVCEGVTHIHYKMIYILMCILMCFNCVYLSTFYVVYLLLFDITIIIKNKIQFNYLLTSKE